MKKQELERQLSKKEKEVRELKDIAYGVRTLQGVLASNPSKPNQDRFLVKRDPVSGRHFFIVADGHGLHGHHVSEFIVK
jgi:serine/threonine protein phosphatase PrpC